MFFHVQMSRHVTLHPAYFGQNFQLTLERKLKVRCMSRPRWLLHGLFSLDHFVVCNCLVLIAAVCRPRWKASGPRHMATSS